MNPEKLWTEFENVLYETNFELDKSINVTQYMKSWTEQAGYPLVNILKYNNTFIVTQVIISNFIILTAVCEK